jgi:type IV pilus assembly protein PilE
LVGRFLADPVDLIDVSAGDDMSRVMHKRSGFSLIELMVALAIIAILAAIALPSYRQYVIRSHRRAAQTSLMDIASRQHQYFVANRAYASTSDLGYVLPTEVDEYYDFDIALDAGPPPNFTITFTPQGGQASDGDLTLDGEGVKTPAEKW